jgi:hypothetical protein
MADTSIDTTSKGYNTFENDPDKPSDENVSPPALTPEELAERSFDLNKLFAISQIRESPHPQFDGMGYMKYNETNEMADISYIVPKKNKFDTRVTSGITHEKDTSILALIENFKFEPQVSVFCKDKEMPELSTSLTSWVRKTLELDHYDEKRPIHYRNLIVQGTSFAQVKRIQRWIPNKVIDNTSGDYTDLDGIKWENMGYKKQFEGITCDIVDGKKVFLEDFYQTDIRKQVGIYTVEYVPREMVESIWKNSPRWKNVPKKCAPNGTIGAMITQGSIYSDWFFITLDFDKVEVIQALRPYENRYQIYLNGVPMLKAGFPLTAISPSGTPFIAKGDIDPMNMCAYSKGIPAKTKMDQALYDAINRIALIKFEQSAFPPSGNNSGRTLSPDIFMPSKITRNLRKEDISILTDNIGLQNSDFNYMQLIKEQIDNKSITSLLENGAPQDGTMTLGQYLDMQKRQLIKLGSIFDGVINWEKQIAHLILMDLLYNAPLESSNVPIKDTFENGSSGLRVLRFNTNNTGTPADLHDEELQYQKETGQDVRFTDMDPLQLRAMVNNPDYYFYWEIVPVDKNNDKVTQAFFISMITQAANLFGMDSMKVQNLKQRYAQVMGEQFDDLFLDDQELQMKQEAMQAQAMQEANGGPKVPVAPGIKPPTEKTLEKTYQ